MFFNFNEANILKQNLFNANDTKRSVLDSLHSLEDNTSDDYLKYSIRTLINKVSALSEQQVASLKDDILNKRFIITYCNHI